MAKISKALARQLDPPTPVPPPSFQPSPRDQMMHRMGVIDSAIGSLQTERNQIIAALAAEAPKPIE